MSNIRMSFTTVPEVDAVTTITQVSMRRTAAPELAKALATTSSDCRVSIEPRGEQASIVVMYIGGERRGDIVKFEPVPTYDKKSWRKLVKLAKTIYSII